MKGSLFMSKWLIVPHILLIFSTLAGTLRSLQGSHLQSAFRSKIRTNKYGLYWRKKIKFLAKIFKLKSGYRAWQLTNGHLVLCFTFERQSFKEMDPNKEHLETSINKHDNVLNVPCPNSLSVCTCAMIITCVHQVNDSVTRICMILHGTPMHERFRSSKDQISSTKRTTLG